MTLRDQILALEMPQFHEDWGGESGRIAWVECRKAILALIPEGPTPTQIEAGAQALAAARGFPDDHLAGARDDFAHEAEAVLRAAMSR